MARIALRLAVLALAGLTAGCFYYPYGYGYRPVYPGYAYRPAPVVVYPGYRY